VDVTGGSLTINAQGDGLDSNGNASISGGTVVVNGPTNSGNGALDVNGELTVTGGRVAAAGSAGMVVTPGARRMHRSPRPRRRRRLRSPPLTHPPPPPTP
jgi:phage baseplate assembly protein gpV